ncbi:TPA: winged helix-turn-helix transcriptional regulator [Corynebacterium striatum]|uniref:ArsR/SmtB family transcription factor n=1 Tax=Corynebacterium striatum TaxID=43770 RepID=UPI00155983D3|nr:winged helix-turn-helix transcriptional regulator [Corynebacterium striatum]HBC8575425.1 winged helix-turn-helix transcriptional regulator [Corynebacterium striatum]HCG2986159.1 winged helix-turn-helix transcriptional regulator [Corynebacterium striatum]HCG3009355.1 winged helix-turn-helix transcriptional regulator [Corynebacterium striatum]HCG3160657.1 winged helix-turn-helix transcriptional regulator [Corynebacterium striatum]
MICVAKTTAAVSPFDVGAAATVISALDSPLRIRLVQELHERDHYVHELVAATGKSQPLVSQHLRVLKKAGIVDSERSGREVLYKLVVPGVLTLLADASALISR